MNTNGISWKTTAAGLGVGGLGLAQMLGVNLGMEPATVTGIVSMLIMFGFSQSRDGDVSSAQTRARKGLFKMLFK